MRMQRPSSVRLLQAVGLRRRSLVAMAGGLLLALRYAAISGQRLPNNLIHVVITVSGQAPDEVDTRVL